MTHVTCRLTAKNRDQLRNPTLGNRVWAAGLAFLVTRAVTCWSVSSSDGGWDQQQQQQATSWTERWALWVMCNDAEQRDEDERDNNSTCTLTGLLHHWPPTQLATQPATRPPTTRQLSATHTHRRTLAVIEPTLLPSVQCAPRTSYIIARHFSFHYFS